MSILKNALTRKNMRIKIFLLCYFTFIRIKHHLFPSTVYNIKNSDLKF